MLLTLLARFLAHPRVTDWLIRRAERTPYVHITSPDGTAVYMYRYWLFNPYPLNSSGKRNWFPISIRLHRIMRADEDRDHHDHPWNARTFILRGHYEEVRKEYLVPWASPTGKRLDYEVAYRRSAGSTAALKFGEFHQITKVSDGGVWTLFVTGKYRGGWGFDVDGVKVPYSKYLGIPDA